MDRLALALTIGLGSLLALTGGCGSDSDDGGSAGSGTGGSAAAGSGGTGAVGGSGGGSGAGGSSGGGVTDYFSRSLQLECKKALECCTDAEIGILFDDTVAAVTTCAETPQNADSLVSGLLQPSIDAGRLVFDQARADLCLAALDGLSCSDYSTHQALLHTSFCESPLLPQQADGDPCQQSYECTSGNCTGATLGQDGQCQPMPGANETCEEECAAGYYCDIGACTPWKADGETCFFSGECQSTHCEDGGSGRVCLVMCDGK